MSLFQDLEDEVIADIARRVKKTGRYTETAELMAKHMREQGYSPAKIQAEVMKYLRADKDFQMAVAENTKAYKEEVREIIQKTVAEAKKAGDELIAEAGDMAWNEDLSMWSENGVDLKRPNSMSQLKTAFAAQTANELKNLTRSTGFKNANSGTVGVANAYQRELDLALLKVATGTFSYDQAVQDCVHRLAESGLRSINYESGRAFQLDTAVRMCVRTGCSQLAGRIMEANLESTGQDLVITSQHMGSRPEHAPWQNKVFSYSGKSKKYPDFFKETGYGTVTGLKGANCTHDFYPFWEGASVIPEDIKEPEPVMIDGKEYTYYQATQKQRSMERDIRALKREINACEALDMDSAELQSRLKMKTAEYRKFSDSANLKPKNNRLRVANASISKKNGSLSSESELGAFKKRIREDGDMGKEYYSLLKEKFSHGSDDAKRVFNKYVPVDSVANSRYEGTAEFRHGKIYMHYGVDAHNDRGAGATWYHEHGHMVDVLAGNASNDPIFLSTLKREFLDFLTQKSYSEIEAELIDMRTQSAVSDIINGLSGDAIKGVAIHPVRLDGTSYWTEETIRQEAFAHMFECQFDDLRYAEMQKYFPKSLVEFERILKDL